MNNYDKATLDKLSKLREQIQRKEQQAMKTQEQLRGLYDKYAQLTTPFKAGDHVVSTFEPDPTVLKVIGVHAYPFDYRRSVLRTRKVLANGKLAKQETNLHLTDPAHTPQVRLAEADEVPKPKASTPPKKAGKKKVTTKKAVTKATKKKSAA